MAKAAKEKRERRAKILQEGGDPDAVVEETAAPAEEETPIDPNHETLIGFSRLYSGTIVLGQSLYAVLPKYNAALGPQHPSNARHLTSVKVEQLYMMMGRELVAVPQVQAGNLFAIGGLEGTVGRNATLCGMGKEKDVHDGAEREQDKDCLVNLAGVILTVSCALHSLVLARRLIPWLHSLLRSFVSLLSPPSLVRFSFAPLAAQLADSLSSLAEMSKLVEGLRMLNQADPCVETLVQETGEHVILTAGELHLEVRSFLVNLRQRRTADDFFHLQRCLKDLRDRFARIEITVSPPIVPFRETAVSGIGQLFFLVRASLSQADLPLQTWLLPRPPTDLAAPSSAPFNLASSLSPCAPCHYPRRSLPSSSPTCRLSSVSNAIDEVARLKRRATRLVEMLLRVSSPSSSRTSGRSSRSCCRTLERSGPV